MKVCWWRLRVGSRLLSQPQQPDYFAASVASVTHLFVKLFFAAPESFFQMLELHRS